MSSAAAAQHLAHIPPPLNDHTMRTRGKSGFRVPRDVLDLHTELTPTMSPIPKTYRGALADPNWHAAMSDEFATITWDLVPPPPGCNVVSGKWVYRYKLKPDGTLDRYKARWVLRGFSQQQDIDFDETFSPVVKLDSIHTVLSIALHHNWPIRQLDVKNAFLHGHLAETVYAQQPSSFLDPAKASYVCRLNRSLYGLKRAPRAWFTRFTSYILGLAS